MKDFDIVELYLNRDEKAIKESAAAYGARLRQLAEGITGSAEDAVECENDTYLAAWNEIPPERPHDYLYAFLARITRCRALNYVRDKSRLKRKAEYVEFTAEMAECLPSAVSTDDSVNENLLSAAISSFLYNQKLEKRQMFMRRYWYFDSEADIAEHFEVSLSKVKVTLHRMREELKKYLEKEGFEVGR